MTPRLLRFEQALAQGERIHSCQSDHNGAVVTRLSCMSPCCRGSAASPRVWARAQHTKRDGFAFDRRRYRSSVARNSVPWPRRSRCITLATQGSGLLGTSPFPLTLERCVGDSLG